MAAEKISDDVGAEAVVGVSGIGVQGELAKLTWCVEGVRSVLSVRAEWAEGELVGPPEPLPLLEEATAAATSSGTTPEDLRDAVKSTLVRN